jgi:hypothetical protein
MLTQADRAVVQELAAHQTDQEIQAAILRSKDLLAVQDQAVMAVQAAAVQARQVRQRIVREMVEPAV